MNPTVETDLVGDLVELVTHEWISGAPPTYEGGRYAVQRSDRGRVRAVTADKDGEMVLWLQAIDEECVAAFWQTDPRVAIGDVVCVATRGGANTRIRLIEYSK